MSKNKSKHNNKGSKSSTEGYGHSGSGFISFADVTTPSFNIHSSSSSSNSSSSSSSSSSRAAADGYNHNDNIHDTTTTTTAAAAILSPIYRGNDPELAISCKRMVKKDITTKLKSFKEIMILLQATR